MAKQKETKTKKETKGNNVALLAALGTIAIVVATLAFFLLVDSLSPFERMERNPPLELMQHWFMISSALASAVLVLSLYLIYTYLKDYLELKSKFTLGILLAVFSFMLFAITSNPVLHRFLGLDRGGMGPFSLMPILFAAISLAILAWISSK